ncbi:hypothetical protein SETIT_2G206400v2 [Setaria italica]|uniref:GRF-type domain-containing protein n=1 Tax=Setaria italica TaxID=4555 RepID=A0A368Q102_SETIT|nr:hypothetical protein SETIT_2G206400v2 [Setaria italica]
MHPSSEGRTTAWRHLPTILPIGILKNKCDHGLRAVVKYSWTFLNPGRWFACCPKEEKEQCGYMIWIDPEWDDRTFGVLVKLMKKKVQVEEDAKK